MLLALRPGAQEDAANRVAWKYNKGTAYVASPIFCGDTFVIKAGPTFEVLATNSIAEPVWAWLAIARGVVFIRGERHLFGIRRNVSSTS